MLGKGAQEVMHVHIELVAWFERYYILPLKKQKYF
jgi:hypothetical protein